MKITTLFFVLLVLAGCSKSSTPEPEFYLTASIDGKPWIANTANSQSTNVAATVSQNLVVVVGAQTVDNTVTAVGVVFPKTIELNKAVAVDPSKYTAVAYSVTQANGYSVDPARGGSGTLTVTRLDEKAGVIEGTFSGTAVYNTNSDRVSITDGRFRTALYTTTVTTPPPGKR